MPDLTRLSSMTRSQTVDELLTRRWVERGPIAASHARRVPVGLGVNLAADTPGGFVAEGSPTPKFKRPAVIETLLGVQFGPLSGHSRYRTSVLFWSQIRSAYPNQEMKPPLGPEVEDFGMSVAPGGVKVMLSTEPEARCWFIDPSQTQLIQLQRDRFIRNWRKVTGQEPYPEYAFPKPRFAEDWARFLRLSRTDARYRAARGESVRSNLREPYPHRGRR